LCRHLPGRPRAVDPVRAWLVRPAPVAIFVRGTGRCGQHGPGQGQGSRPAAESNLQPGGIEIPAAARHGRAMPGHRPTPRRPRGRPHPGSRSRRTDPSHSISSRNAPVARMIRSASPTSAATARRPRGPPGPVTPPASRTHPDQGGTPGEGHRGAGSTRRPLRDRRKRGSGTTRVRTAASKPAGPSRTVSRSLGDHFPFPGSGGAPARRLWTTGTTSTDVDNGHALTPALTPRATWPGRRELAPTCGARMQSQRGSRRSSPVQPRARLTPAKAWQPPERGVRDESPLPLLRQFQARRSSPTICR